MKRVTLIDRLIKASVLPQAITSELRGIAPLIGFASDAAKKGSKREGQKRGDHLIWNGVGLTFSFLLFLVSVYIWISMA